MLGKTVDSSTFINLRCRSISLLFLLVISVFSLVFLGKGDERYVIKDTSSIYLSVEKGWERNGLIPINLDIRGIHLTFFMDKQNNVYEENLAEMMRVPGSVTPVDPLFILDIDHGSVRNSKTSLTGMLYEQNALRTRMRFNGLTVLLSLDIAGSSATIDLGGISLPSRLYSETRAGSLREIEIGEARGQIDGRLYLDENNGFLFWEEHFLPNDENKKDFGRVSWAVRIK